MNASASSFRPTRGEIRKVQHLAALAEESLGDASRGCAREIGGEPSHQLWSRCAFRVAADVRERAGSEVQS